ncbi:MAG: hypothetical protein EAZ99_13050 [Alphaproteobacteria bacterium]|nr:MAG: hypothetical protein EAZ99_13050 [Alphaproteobacteria bacterium]
MTTRPSALIVALHGVGSSALAMEPVVARLRTGLPSVAVIALDAPHPFDQGGLGRQWFSIAGVTEANRAGRIATALPALWSRVDAHLAELHLDRSQLGLFGFSQGAMMALAAGLDERPPAVVAAIAGRLAVAGPLPTGTSPALYIGGGSDDRIVPPQCAREAADRLRESGRKVTLSVVDGLEHAIAPSQLREAIALFQQSFLSAAAA